MGEGKEKGQNTKPTLEKRTRFRDDRSPLVENLHGWCLRISHLPTTLNRALHFQCLCLGEYFQGMVLSSLYKKTKKKQNTFINSQEAKLESKSCVPLSSAPAHCPLERSFLVPYTPTQALPLFFPSPPLCCGSSVHALCRCYPGYSPYLFFCQYQL